MRIFSRSNAVALILYVVLMAAAIGALVYLRNWSQAEFAAADSQRDWDEWKDETARQAKGTGPVWRREAKSIEPPTLVLLRDHFAVSVVAVLLLGTVLFITFFAMIRGALSTAFIPVDDERSPQ